MAGRGNNPSVADVAPTDGQVTDYDRDHLAIYARLLDADRAGASIEEMASVVLGIDPGTEPEWAKRVVRSHLSRARWMTEHGYRQLVGSTS